MIYPQNFEQKIGFTEIKALLNERCQSSLGREQVGEIHFSDDAGEISEWLSQIRDLRKMKEEREDLPLQYFYDMRDSIARMRLEGTHMEEEELFNLKKSLDTIDALIKIIRDPLSPQGGTFYSIRAHKPITITAEGIAGIIVNNDFFKIFLKIFS